MRGRLGLVPVAILLVVVGIAVAIWGWRPSGETPSVASFGFEDWLVRCQGAKDKADPTFGCGISQQILDQRTRQSVLQLHLARAPGGSGHRLVVVLPLGVSVPSGIVLQVGDDKRNVPFTQCLPAGCLAPLAADDALIDKMKAASDGRVFVADRFGKAVAVPFSLKGFAPAFEKMESQGGVASGDATWWTRFWNSSGTK